MTRLLLTCILLLSVPIPLAASALDEGMALFVAGDYEGAKEKFAAHLAAHPDDPTALYHLGVVEKDGLKSKYYFERLVDRHPNHPTADAALFEIGLFYFTSPASLSGPAREEFRRLLRDYPRSPFVPHAHYRIGLIFLAGGAHDAARAAFRKAIQTDAKLEVTPFARAAVAESYLLEGRPDLAVREVEDTWSQKRMEPLLSRLFWIAAEGHAQMGHEAQADSLRALLLTRFPDSDDAYRVASAAGPAPAPDDLARPSQADSGKSIPAQESPPQTTPGAPEPAPLTAQQPDSGKKGIQPAPPGTRYLVQIGMFGRTEKAQALLDRLRRAGFQVHDQTRKIRGKTLRIFTSGPYDDPDEARRIASEIDRREHLGCRVAEVK
jgi:cell division septation protein DedD